MLHDLDKKCDIKTIQEPVQGIRAAGAEKTRCGVEFPIELGERLWTELNRANLRTGMQQIVQQKPGPGTVVYNSLGMFYIFAKFFCENSADLK